MTVCTKQLTFSFHHDKQLAADFKGGADVLRHAGLLLVREIEKRLGRLGEAAQAVRVHKDLSESGRWRGPLRRKSSRIVCATSRVAPGSAEVRAR